jgi:acyl-coenzyme A thioesterase PaaI-like protein
VVERLPTKDEIVDFLGREFPQNTCLVEEVGDRSATVVQQIDSAHLRPGQTVSGPVLMSVADIALYIAILGTIGLVPLAVTTSLTINFLRRPASDRSIVGVSRLIKVGRNLIVGEVSLYSRGEADMVAHAVGTYSIPPRR